MQSIISNEVYQTRNTPAQPPVLSGRIPIEQQPQAAGVENGLDFLRKGKLACSSMYPTSKVIDMAVFVEPRIL